MNSDAIIVETHRVSANTALQPDRTAPRPTAGIFEDRLLCHAFAPCAEGCFTERIRDLRAEDRPRGGRPLPPICAMKR
jgi:hypothetical protein